MNKKVEESLRKSNWHDCPNTMCNGNFDGICRQPYLECYLHITPGTKQHDYYLKNKI